MVLKEIHGLGEHGNIPEKLIPSIFNEENRFLDADNILIVKHLYMKCNLQLHKELLDHLEDLMTQDSLVGSTVSTRSKRGGSVVSRMSSPSVKSSNTKTSKHQKLVKKRELQRVQSIIHHWTSIQQTSTIHSCQSQTLKVIKNSMRVAHTFWMKICIKGQTAKAHSCLGLGKAFWKNSCK
jgi:hypothetical protein